MKNIGITVLLFLTLLAMPVKGQQGPLLSRSYHSKLKKGTIRELLQTFIDESGIVVEYISNFLETDRVVSLTGNETTVSVFLQHVLQTQRVTVLEKNGKLILVPIKPPAGDQDAFASTYAIFGFIKEEGSKEPLINATIQEPLTGKGTLTNTFGYFTLSLPAGPHTLRISYVGYATRTIGITLNENSRTDISLSPGTPVPEIVVASGSRLKKYAAKNINAEQANQYPAGNELVGENDPIRSRNLLPGVISVQDYADGFLVRGGSPDQNQFLLDGNEVFNPTHLLGSLSIVNKTSFKSMLLHKSDFPSRFGGGLSSIMDVYTKDGNMEQWQGEANLGFLAASAAVEGPVRKNKTAVMFSFRRSLTTPAVRLLDEKFNARFYDVHFKITHLLNENNKLMLNVYTGHDRMKLQQSNSNNLQKWGNKLGSLNWNHLLGARSFMNTAFNVSHYNNLAGYQYPLYDDSSDVPVIISTFNTYSSISHYDVKTQFEVQPANNIRFNFGGKIAYTMIKPFSTNLSDGFIENVDDYNLVMTLPFKEYTLYYENEINIDNRLLIRPGVHFNHYRFRNFHFNSIQPRFFASYKLDDRQQLYAAYNKMTQYLHMVSNPFMGVNNMIWVPSTRLVKPEESTSMSLGYSLRNTTGVSLSAEAYWKKMNNLTSYIEGGNIFSNDNTWEQSILTGKGWSYGLEFQAEKKFLHWQIMCAYTLSWNWRQFNNLNNGRRFPFKYDRRHVLNITVAYKPRNNWSVSAVWNFSSGDAFTLPEKIYPDFDNGQHIVDPGDPLAAYRFIYHYSALNQFHTRPYQRLDAGTDYAVHTGKKVSHKLSAGVYNVLGTASSYNYDLQASLDGKFNISLSRNRLFNISPYISYTIIF
ncbi:hypothetical protein GO495_00780 [Chitinophaga oryziterrae]|uniref:TonB-dependent receptor plug domain-containing protein n=1 Tax=Chitinophaga oryziterrae TaxID=1031224 RepID=A0A6N8J4L7_9BACT|nr:TonB-dependent receptor [Chitinophaga oryziterrae]MVT39102.1 hypothetical protein [Chitinophaga oryziterrae]